MTVSTRIGDAPRPRAAEGLGGGRGGEGAGPLWRRIHAVLAAEIAEGRWAPGERLPSEHALAARFGVNRHTLRRAMAALVEDGAVHVRRGAGATVVQRVLDYPIGARPRFSESLRRAGREPARRILSRETAGARRDEAEALGLPPGEAVHCAETVSLADGVPVAVARTVWPAARLPGFLERLEAHGSVTEALAACGVADYARAWTRMTAERAGTLLARHLGAPDGTPLLRSEALSVDPEGRPIEYGLTWFHTERMPVMVEGRPGQRAPG